MTVTPERADSSPSHPVRVAIVSPTFGGYGGMEAFALALLRQAATRADLDVRLYFKPVRGFALRPELERAMREQGPRIQWVDRASRALWRAVREADVVHAFNASPDVVAAARLAGRPLLVHAINHRVPGASLRQRAWDFCLRRAQRRFYISEFVRRSWEGAATRPGSAVVFPVSELPEGVRPPAERRGFVFAARWIENKGLEVLVEAYAQAGLDPVKSPLRLIGDGPLRERVQARIAALGVRGIERLGFVGAGEKAEAIRSARWLVVPPHTQEEFGRTAIEARAVGVPCIATRDGGVPEAAGAEALLCAPRDVAGLAQCLRLADAMDEAEYAARAERTRLSLARELPAADFYAKVYRQMAASP